MTISKRSIGCCCGGGVKCKICFTVFSKCDDPPVVISGATVTIYRGTTLQDPSEWVEKGHCITNSSGKCCIDKNIKTGSYVVIVSKANCADNLYDVEVTCPETNMVLLLNCDPYVIIFNINGCQNKPVPGAKITVTKGGVNQGSGTTGSDGKWRFDAKESGTYDYTVTSPTPRLLNATGVYEIDFICVQGNISRTLNPAVGYNCCNHPDQPWKPIPTAMHLSFGGVAQDIDFGGCIFGDCVEVPTPDSGTGILTRQCNPPINICGGLLPLDFGTNPAMNLLSLDLTGGNQAVALGRACWREDQCDDGICGPKDRWQLWYAAYTTCEQILNAYNMTYNANSFVINSWDPFSATWNWDMSEPMSGVPAETSFCSDAGNGHPPFASATIYE